VNGPCHTQFPIFPLISKRTFAFATIVGRMAIVRAIVEAIAIYKVTSLVYMYIQSLIYSKKYRTVCTDADSHNDIDIVSLASRMILHDSGMCVDK